MADLKISQLTGATTPLAGTEVLPIVQSGSTVKVSIANLTAGRAVASAGGTFSDNFVQGTAAKGVNFTANTPAAGMTSQLLNWYEEGAFTPTITGGSSNPTVTYNRQFGTYTRIGRCVYFIIYIEITTITGGSGDAYISGLPFTCASGTQFYSPIEAWTSGVNWTGTVLKPLVVQGATSIWLLGNTDNAAYGATPVTDLANGNEFRMSGMYFV